MSLMDALKNAWTKRMEIIIYVIKVYKMMSLLLLGTQKNKTLVMFYLRIYCMKKLVFLLCVPPDEEECIRQNLQQRHSHE